MKYKIDRETAFALRSRILKAQKTSLSVTAIFGEENQQVMWEELNQLVKTRFLL